MRELQPAAAEEGTTRARLWYDAGLRFSCTCCGNCCTGGPGTVRITVDEIRAIAKQLTLSEGEVRERCTQDVGDDDLSLREKPNHDCVFWNRDAGCTVYLNRPRQCRTWPFWRINVSCRDSWRRAALDCPGMNQGVTFSATYIERTSENDGTLGSARRLRRIG